MKFLSRVVWAEGMYLAPQHFQSQSRYVEDSIEFAASSLWFKPYGLAACQLDQEALKNDDVNIVHAQGVFPDGLTFHIPESDGRPEKRSIKSRFSPARDSHILHLAIPTRKPSGQNFLVGPNGSAGQMRYTSQSVVVRDENNGSDEKPVEVGRKNFDLLLDDELRPGMCSLPLAQVKRDGAGNFIYDETYIPPCLEIIASDRLMMILRRLVDILEAKSDLMSGSARESGQPLVDYFRRDLGNFWLLHTLHSSLGVLRHLLLAKRGHPEELYSELARLGGALCTFSRISAHPRDLPLYDHDNPTECFALLDEHIRRHLELALPVNCVTIPLLRTENFYYAATINDPRLLDNSRWIFGIQARQVGEADLIARTPQRVKLCSDKFIRELVRRAVPGLALSHLSAPPTEVPSRLEAQYFGVTKQGPCWDHIVMTKQVGVYVPGDIPDPEMELHILTDREVKR